MLALSKLSTASPFLPTVILMYNWILDHLEDTIAGYRRGDNVDKDVLIRGLLAEWNKIRKWYSQTSRAAYRNAMCRFCSHPFD